MQRRVGMHRLQELVRLHRLGTGYREVARALGMSPNTERQYRLSLNAAGLLAGDAAELPALERQNREHRAWLSQLGGCDAAQLAAECDAMAAAFNGLVPRRTLAWRTAADVWNHRPPVEVDRLELAAEVEERRKHLEEGSARGSPPGMTERLAIVAALTNRGHLQQTRGGWC